MTECNGCGDCCRVIGAPVTKRRMRERSVYDSEFLLQHWHRVSRPEARRRNPHIQADTPGHFYYECDMFDPDTNSCTAHESKPRVCTGFPWYGGEANTTAIGGLPACSFWADVSAELRPAYVQMGEIRRAS